MKMLLCAAVALLSGVLALGQEYKVLYSFAGAQANDGATPLGNLVFDQAGNLYGTTKLGGATPFCTGCGTVFKLSPNPDGSWTEAVIYSFCSNLGTFSCLDGALPVAGLIFDRKGNLYGTTSSGGANSCPFASGGCGTVFELSPPSSQDAPWTETVLYSFCGIYTNSTCLDGALPLSQLTFDASGQLYGTTSTGGSGGSSGGCCSGGTVFELSQSASGWTETILHNFCANGGDCSDGLAPQAGVTFDRTGNLYGTTERGGNYQGTGTLYKLSPGTSGWTETVLLTTKQSLAAFPLGMVSTDSSGSLYSTFSSGGQNGDGGVFRLGSHGAAAEFSFNGNNGDGPTAGVLIDVRSSALFGTTSGGLSFFGTVFKMTAPAELTLLYSFCSQPNCSDGSEPTGGLTEDGLGNLYGTTKLGGANSQGVVFEIAQSLPKQKGSQRPQIWRTILPTDH
jgi:uncharacterized repeat protein (TIGR03803 family)